MISPRIIALLRENCGAVLSQPVHLTATYWKWRYQMLHQYSSAS